MKRIHLFEFIDQSWLPASLRDAETDVLRLATGSRSQIRIQTDILAEALQRTGAKHIIDLCSGASGPIVPIVRELRTRGLDVQAQLTDLYPNLTALAEAAAASSGRITYSAQPVDATAVAPQLRGFRTMFNCFHHFRPAAARRVLMDAVQARAAIAVFEVISRQMYSLYKGMIGALSVFKTVARMRPRSRRAWLWTYVVPALPVVVLWDGLVSRLRVYSEAELHALTGSIDAPDYRWHIGRVPMKRTRAFVTYLWGAPVELLPSLDPAV